MTRIGAHLVLLLAVGCGESPVPTERDGGADVRLSQDAGVGAETGPLSCSEGVPCGVSCVDTETDVLNCGGCGRACSISNGSADCSLGTCAIGFCDPGFFDRDGELENGCESETGGCVPGGECATECMSPGVTACDGDVATCTTPAESCNFVDDNCDGGCDVGAPEGCRVGVHRGYGNGHVFTADLSVASSAPFRLEGENRFYLYSTAVAATRPLFRCRKGDGRFLLTDSTNCESLGARVEELGFISAEPGCGSTPLYRVFNGNNHFYTTSAPERDNAVNNLSYASEGVAGHVWLTP